MIEAYVDSNVLIRFLMGDDPEMAERVRRSLTAAADGQIRLILTPVVMAELVWTLSSFYRLKRKEVAGNLLRLLTLRGLEVRDRDAVTVALSLFGERNLDFVDAFLAACALVEGPGQICTFDRHFRNIPGLTVVEPGSDAAPPKGA